jgi:hypothetical protein
MGNWKLNIDGVGCHHNNKPFDVENLAEKFVAQLRAEGHHVATANVSAGGKDIDLLNPPIKERKAASLSSSLAALTIVLLWPLLAHCQCLPGDQACKIGANKTATIVFEIDPPGGEIWIGGKRQPTNVIQTPSLGDRHYAYDAVIRWHRAGKPVDQAVKTPSFKAGDLVKVPVKLTTKDPGAKTSLVDGATLDAGEVNFGIDVRELAKHPTESCSINGNEVPRIEAVQALAATASGLRDDRKFLRLTVTGTPDFRRAVAEGLARPDAESVRERLLVQSYTPDAWAVKDAGFKPGNQIYLQAPDGTVLHRQEDFAGGVAALVETIRKADASYRSERDPDLRNDSGDLLLALLAAAAALALWS